MKKAEEYLAKLQPVDFNPKNLAKAIERLIKQAQLDAIEYAVKKCVENAKAIDIVGGKAYVINASILITIDQIKEEMK